jgi:hypothetical protein
LLFAFALEGQIKKQNRNEKYAGFHIQRRWFAEVGLQPEECANS